MNLTKSEKVFFVDDGANRGPMTMIRLRFHPTQARLVGQCVDRRVAVWDLEASPEKVDRKKEAYVVGKLLCPHELGWVRGLDVHPSGKTIATGGSDRTLRLWNWDTGGPAASPTHNIAAHEGWVEAVAYSPDGGLLVSVGADRVAKVWNADDLKPIKTLAGHSAYCADVTFTPDGKRFITGAEDGVALVWDAATLEEVRRIDFGSADKQFGQGPRHSGVHRLAVSHDSRWLGVAGGEAVSIFDLTTGELVATESMGMQIAFHPSSDTLAAGESEVKVWQYEANKFAPAEKDKNGKPKKTNGIPGRLAAAIKRGDWSLGMRFSDDGKRLALGKSDGTVEMYDIS